MPSLRSLASRSDSQPVATEPLGYRCWVGRQAAPATTTRATADNGSVQACPGAVHSSAQRTALQQVTGFAMKTNHLIMSKVARVRPQPSALTVVYLYGTIHTAAAGAPAGARRPGRGGMRRRRASASAFDSPPRRPAGHARTRGVYFARVVRFRADVGCRLKHNQFILPAPVADCPVYERSKEGSPHPRSVDHLSKIATHTAVLQKLTAGVEGLTLATSKATTSIGGQSRPVVVRLPMPRTSQ